MWYVYENHLSGDLYITENEQEYGDLYCERCGDSDRLIDTFETKEEAKEFVENKKD